MGKLSFGTTGIAYECDKVTMDSSGAPRCPRCQERVYYNEEKKAIGRSWHNRCFICLTCRRSLDSTNCNEHDGEVYCGSCHRRQFGPRGYGFAGGAAGLSTESTADELRPQPNSQVYAVPQNIPASSIDPNSLDCCPGCGKRVYHAEEVKALKRSWHKLCFKCKACRKLLELGSCSEHEGNIFCRACYSKQFGPKGYGFAGGAGSMLAAEDRYSVEARSVNGVQSSGGETYTLLVKPSEDRAVIVDDRYTSDGRSVNLSQSADGQTYTLETRRKPSASSVQVPDRYIAETARGVNGKVGLPADSHYTSPARGGNGPIERRAGEHVYTTQPQGKQSASSRLFPDERHSPETRFRNDSPERPAGESYSIQTRAQPSAGSTLPVDDRYNRARFINDSNGMPTDTTKIQTLSSPGSGHIPEYSHNTKARFMNGSPERPTAESYSIQARAQPTAGSGLPSDAMYINDVRRVNGTTGESYSIQTRPQPNAGFGLAPDSKHMPGATFMNVAAERPPRESYSSQTRAQPSAGFGLAPDARYASEPRLMNGSPERRTSETYSIQTRAQPSGGSGLTGDSRYATDVRRVNGAAESYGIHSRSGSGFADDGRNSNARFMNSSTNESRFMNGATDRPSGDKYAIQARVVSNASSAQFADDRFSVESNPIGRYTRESRAVAPMTTADVEERRYSIHARATPSAAYRPPAQNGPGKAAPVYV